MRIFLKKTLKDIMTNTHSVSKNQTKKTFITAVKISSYREHTLTHTQTTRVQIVKTCCLTFVVESKIQQQQQQQQKARKI